MRARGPVESWVASVLDAALDACPGVAAATGAVDVAAPSKLGEARAQIRFSSSARLDRNAWRALAEGLAQHPALERVVPVPPGVYLTFAPGVLESALARCAGAAPLPAPAADAPGVVVVFCSPNTNKPLHIGHLRACFLGMSLSRLLEAAGTPVARSQMLSNFGIHMCQALAMHDGTSTPSTAGVKGDHFVGALYRSYHDAVAAAPDLGCEGGACNSDDPPCVRCRPGHLLRRIASGDRALFSASERLGEWAIEGILETQRAVGTEHDTCIRESGVIERAVETLERAVAEGACLRRDDGSTYIPVRSTGEAELTLLRRDGTSLVFSMLLGVYLTRAEIFPGWQVVELTGEQWRAGRTAMYEVLRRIGRDDLSERTEGVFFGMVQAGGKVMQSRAGTVVDADALLGRTAFRVAGWEAATRQVRDDPARRAELAATVVKYHVLRFARGEGFDFDEEAMWDDSTRRIESVLRALQWCGRAGAAPAGHEKVRPLSLLLARQGAVAGRALAKRDPAILVRYLDEVADKIAGVARAGAPTADVAAAAESVIRRTLALLDVRLP